jgi:predicted AlkP superfamily phosphohydrolase/phosphomutase
VALWNSVCLVNNVINRKVAMIGIDAAELSVIEASPASFPNLSRALERGATRRLCSTAGALAGSVWPTFYTGAAPGEHGVYHHLQWDAQAMRLRRVSADWLYCEPFWYELERRGLRVIAMDVPMSFPSRLSRGVEVINWGSHDQLGPLTTQPRELKGEIHSRFGAHPMGYEIPVNKTRAELARIRDNLVAGARIKGEFARWLLGAHEWDFSVVVFGECHRGGHILWPENGPEESIIPHDALIDVYRAVDDAVGQLLGAMPDQTTVIIFALHGMGPNNSQEHFVPKIMDQVNGRFHGDRGQAVPTDAPAAQGQRSVMRMLRERVPARLQNAIAQAVPVAVRDLVVNRATTGGFDWPRTPGLALLADLNGYLRFNLQGRESRGAVDVGSERFERYVELLRECFHSFRIASSGEPLVNDLLLADQDFPGKRSHHLPDVIVTWSGAAPTGHVISPMGGEIVAELATGRSGNHRPDGFCAIIDPDPANIAPAQPESIRDLASIVFNILSDPASSRLSFRN